MCSARGNSRKFRFQSENRKRELDLPQDKKHDLQANLRKISNRRRPNLITKGFYLQCRKKMVCTYHGQIKRATKKFDYGCQAQSKLQLSWTGLLYPQLIHHISISNPPCVSTIKLKNYADVILDMENCKYTLFTLIWLT